MKTSPAGITKIEEREGIRLTAYHDSAGLLTIACGHLLTKSEVRTGMIVLSGVSIPWHEGLSVENVARLLQQDIQFPEVAISHAVTSPLSQNQFDTLVSVVFNIGVTGFASSTFLKYINLGKYDQVPAQLRLWIHSGGKVDPILVKRRESEILQWNEG